MADLSTFVPSLTQSPNTALSRSANGRARLARYASGRAGGVYWMLGRMAMNTTLVSRDPDIMSGALCFKGTRVPVQNLFDCLEGASSLEDFLEDFPSVSRENGCSGA